MATKIQLRHDTSAAWGLADPILAEGEMGIETDTQRAKLGNGEDTWSVLPYMADTSFEGNYVAKIGPATESVQTIIGESGLKTEGLLESEGGVKVSGGNKDSVRTGMWGTTACVIGAEYDVLASFKASSEPSGIGFFPEAGSAYGSGNAFGIEIKPSCSAPSAARFTGVSIDFNSDVTATTEVLGFRVNGNSKVFTSPAVVGYLAAAINGSNVYGYKAATDLVCADGGTAVGFESNLTITANKNNFNFYAEGTAPNFFAGDTYIGGTTSRNTFELWKSTLTEEQLEQYEAGTYAVPANVATPGDGSFARAWYYDQQDAETQAALDAGTREYPEHLAAATFTDTFALGDNTKIRLANNGFIEIKSGAPSLRFTSEGGSENNKTFLFKNQSAGSELAIQAVDDAGAGGGNLFKFTRSGKSVEIFEGYKDGSSWLEINNRSKTVTVNGLVESVGGLSTSGGTGDQGAIDTNKQLKISRSGTDSYAGYLSYGRLQGSNNYGLSISALNNNIDADILIAPKGGKVGIGTDNPSVRFEVAGGDVEFSDDLTIGGDATISGTLDVTGAVDLASDLTVDGQINLSGGGGATQALQKQEIQALIAAAGIEGGEAPGAGLYVALAGDENVQTISGSGGLKTNGLLESVGGLSTSGGTGDQGAIDTNKQLKISRSGTDSYAGYLSYGRLQGSNNYGLSISALNNNIDADILIAPKGGKVGIGVDNPTVDFEVAGEAKFNDDVEVAGDLTIKGDIINEGTATFSETIESSARVFAKINRSTLAENPTALLEFNANSSVDQGFRITHNHGDTRNAQINLGGSSNSGHQHAISLFTKGTQHFRCSFNGDDPEVFFPQLTNYKSLATTASGKIYEATSFSLGMETDDPTAFTTTYTLDEEGNQVQEQIYNGPTEDLLSIIKDLRARVTALENA